MEINISIHPPREGWDNTTHWEQPVEYISIHPPREGWDMGSSIVPGELVLFQSTHPVRGGTSVVTSKTDTVAISIHPPREGWDSKDAQNEPSSYEPLRQKRIRRGAFGKAKTLFL